MKEAYEKPHLEEIYFRDTDVIITSGGANKDWEDGGDND